MDEVNRWAESIMLATDDYPDYIMELCVYKGYLKDLYKVLGFAPSAGLSDNEFIALHAIADTRGVARFEPFPTKEQAARALAKQPNILRRFKEQFPHVQISA